MKLKNKLVLGALIGVLITWKAAFPAYANSFDFNFTLDNGDTGSGIFITSGLSGGSYLITQIVNGELNVPGSGKEAITLLAPIPGNSFNDNLLYPSNPLLDADGLGFTTPDTVQWALWSGGGILVDSWCNNSGGGADHLCASEAGDPFGAVTAFEVSQTPLPSTWMMLIAGFVGLGYFAFRGSKKNSALIAAA